MVYCRGAAGHAAGDGIVEEHEAPDEWTQEALAEVSMFGRLANRSPLRTIGAGDEETDEEERPSGQLDPTTGDGDLLFRTMLNRDLDGGDPARVVPLHVAAWEA